MYIFSAGLLLSGLFRTIAWGMAATLGQTSVSSISTVGVSVGGIDQFALASNRFVETGMVLGHGVSSLTWMAVTLGVASGCCLCWVVLQLGTEGISSTWGLPVGQGIPSIFPCAKLYTVSGMDVGADFTIGVWVVAVEMAAMGVGSSGRIGFMGKVGVTGIGWAITLTLYLLFTGTLPLLFFSAFLDTKVFLVK